MSRLPYDADLDWWFSSASTLLGERGSLSSTIAALERGNAASHAYEEPFGHLPLHEWHHQMARERGIRTRLLSLPRAMRELLEAHYTTVGKRLPFMTGRFGDLAGAVVYMAKGASLDIFSAKNAKDIEKLEETADRELREAHKAWKATKPKPRILDFDLSFLNAMAAE